MRQITIFIIFISLVFGGEKIANLFQKQIQQLPLEIQKQISKKTPTWKHIPGKPSNRSMMDPSDLYGEWGFEDSDATAYLTVGTDQQMLNFMQRFGIEQAEGGIGISGTVSDTLDFMSIAGFEYYGDGISVLIMLSNNPIYFGYYDDYYNDIPEGFELPFYMFRYASGYNNAEGSLVIADTVNGEWVEYEYEFGDVGDTITIDSSTYRIEISGLTVSNDAGDSTYFINGTITPGTIDLVAGVPTEMSFFSGDFGPDVGEDETMSTQYFDDGTGYEIYSGFDEYYYDEWTDTTEFDWSATNDSLTLIFHEFDEYYYEEYDDTVTVAYEIMILDSGTYVYMSADFDLCEFIVSDDDDYTNEDSCYADIERGLGITDIESITIDFWMEMIYVGPLTIAGEIGLYPDGFILHRTYPNPFNPTTTLKYELGSAGSVSIDVFDVNGRKIRSLYNGISSAGPHEIRWNARDNQGRQMSSGVYLFKVNVDGKVQTAKMLLLK